MKIGLRKRSVDELLPLLLHYANLEKRCAAMLDAYNDDKSGRWEEEMRHIVVALSAIDQERMKLNGGT